VKQAAQGRRSLSRPPIKVERGEGRLHNAIYTIESRRQLPHAIWDELTAELTSGQSEVNLYFGIYLHGLSVE